MSGRVMVGIFQDVDDVLSVTREVRKRGYTILDIYAPYPVHGLDKAMGLQPSRLPWVCFLLGLLGAAAKVWFEYWTTASDWPLNVGGKPWNSLPAFVPITFEVMVLFAGVSTVIAFFMVSRLYPGRRGGALIPGVTDDRFALVLDETDAAFEPGEVRRLLAQHGAVDVIERAEESVR
jgi:hypothetical protein